MNEEQRQVFAATVQTSEVRNKEIRSLIEGDKDLHLDDGPANDRWELLPINKRVKRDMLFDMHFAKAWARFDAGVPLVAIHTHYQSLGMEVSLATFRKLWQKRVEAMPATATATRA